MWAIATRHEKVVLDLEDRFSGPMARAAAATQLLDHSLKDLDGSAVRTNRDMAPLGDPNGPIGKTGVQSVQASREIDRMSGRMRIFLDAAAILGPALVPIGAVGIPAIAGLATSLGAAALAGGVAVAAFQGVGTALEAVNKAALEPTAANLEAAQLAMERLGPQARQFVTELQGIMPALQGVRNAGAAGLFPGLTQSLDDMVTLLPRVEEVAHSIGRALGNITAQGAQGLTGGGWMAFLTFLETDVPPVIENLGRTVGNLASGLAQLWMGFDPVSDDFIVWMTRASAAFESWATGLSQTQGFREFVAYLRDTGPQVGEALASIANALLQIVQAAAPLGGPVLQALTAVADAIAAIAGSDAGPAIMATVTALAILSRGMKTFQAVSSTAWAQTVRGTNQAATAMEVMAARRSAVLRGGAALAGLAIAASDVGDSFKFANTASGALLGAVGGPWGAAIGGAVGLLVDLGGSGRDAAADMQELTDTLNQQTGAITQLTREKAAGQLFDKGAIDAARELGISLPDLTDAYLGNSDAISRVNYELEGMRSGLFDADGRIAVSGDTLRTFRDNFHSIVGVLGDAGPELDEQGDKIKAIGDAAGDTAGDYDQATGAVQRFTAAVEASNRVLSRRDAARSYQQSLDDFRKGLKGVENAAKLVNRQGQFNRAVQGGRDLEAQFDNMAAAAVKFAGTLKKQDRVPFLRQARSDMLDMADKLNINEAAARRLINRLLGLGKQNPKPKAELQDEVSPRVDAILSRLRSVDGTHVSATATVTTRYETLGRRPGNLPTLPGGYAGGGYTGDIDPRAPAGIVHGREFVFSADATRGNIAMLETLHRQLRGYDRGGYVAPPTVNVNLGGGSLSGILRSPDGFMAAIDARIDARVHRAINSRDRFAEDMDR